MLSYRHAFHAGNHADVLKHFCLFTVLNYFNLKNKPYWYIDTHAGAGLYQLNHQLNNKNAEYLQGIEQLYQNKNLLPTNLRQFIEHIEAQLEKNIYYGSSILAQTLLRDIDKSWLYELHPTDYEYLINNIQELNFDHKIHTRKEDGFTHLISLLPPPTARSVILIDPPYELKSDYEAVFKTLQKSIKRFKNGCYLVWYPCLSRPESQLLPKQLKTLSDHFLQVELHISQAQADGFGMFGSGMFIVNPPYTLVEILKNSMDHLLLLLKQDKNAHFILEEQTK